MSILIKIYTVVVKFIYLPFLNIKFGERIKIKGIPLLEVRRGGSITIGHDVVLNSINFGYHLNMHSPVKIFAEGKGVNISIGDNSRLNGVCLHACDFIHIGKNCLFAANVQIIDSDGHELSFSNPSNRINTVDTPRGITIEDNVWVGANVFILKGVTIGEGSVIAAGSVVTKDVEARTLASGVAAKKLNKV